MTYTDTRQRLFDASKIKFILDTGQTVGDIIHKIVDAGFDFPINAKTHGKTGKIELDTLDLVITFDKSSVKVTDIKTKRILYAKQFVINTGENESHEKLKRSSKHGSI